MPQVFHKSANAVARISFIAFPVMFAITGVSLAVFYRSSYATGVNEILEQPIPFSHLHHVGQLGIDCRYCHTTVETSSFANIPPTKTCMNCHQQMWVGADLLGPVRESYAKNEPIHWKKVHNLPEYAYFNHSIHVSKGVGCYSCHGQVDQMPLMFQSKSLLMEWCLKCHRNPENNLRPKEEITSMTWTPNDLLDSSTKELNTNSELSKEFKEWCEKNKIVIKESVPQKDLGLFLKEKYHVRDAITLTSCSNCHR